MEWTPDRHGKIPLYLQIANYFEQRICRGELPPGTKLPPERKLAEQLRVHRGTVVAAYEVLRGTGIIERLPGSGTYVSKHQWGVIPSTPNWRQYVERKTFLPQLSLLNKIREHARNQNDLIDLAIDELSESEFSNEEFRELTRQYRFCYHVGYDHPQGLSPLRKTVAAHLQQHRIKSDPEAILITSGAQQALFLITHCLLSPGDAIAIEDPSYYYSLPLFQSAGLRLFRLPLDKRGIQPSDIVSLYKKHRIRMIFLNPRYQNPTGQVLDLPRKKQILDICTELKIPIVEDDVYALLSFEKPSDVPMKSLDTTGNVLYIGSLSKVLSSSLRIGWLVGPQSVIDRLTDARLQMDFGLSVFPQRIAHQLLSSPLFPNFLKRLCEILKSRRDRLVSSLETDLQGEVEFTKPEGGLHLWCQLKNKVDDEHLLKSSLKRGVLIMPGKVFGSNSGFVRFSYARTVSDKIAIGVKQFAEAYFSCN